MPRYKMYTPQELEGFKLRFSFSIVDHQIIGKDTFKGNSIILPENKTLVLSNKGKNMTILKETIVIWKKYFAEDGYNLMDVQNAISIAKIKGERIKEQIIRKYL